MPISKTPAFNLKVVLRETGLAADTLRAWERRYGLPVPQRSPGGHRLYSQYDIETIKWLMARQGEGLSISRAVEMWKEELAQGHDPLPETLERAPLGMAAMQQPIFLPPETNLDAVRSHWLAACLNFNESAAEQALNQAFSLYPVETVCVDVLQRGIAEIGMLWYEGRASVQQEHFASGLAMRRLDALLAAAPIPTRGKTILVGCPAEEWHTFTALMLTLFLRRRGWAVIYLGANVPLNRFEETVAVVNADLILLAAHHLVSAATLQQAAHQLARRGGQVVYGGRIFNLQPELRGAIPGFFLGERIDLAIENIERLLMETPAPPTAFSPSKEYLETLQAFVIKRPLIEAAITGQLRTSLIPLENLEIAHRYLGNNLQAALQLGNMRYLDGEIDWLVHMLKGQHQSEQPVYHYLSSYAHATSQILGEQSALIVNWINSIKATP